MEKVKNMKISRIYTETVNGDEMKRIECIIDCEKMVFCEESFDLFDSEVLFINFYVNKVDKGIPYVTFDITPFPKNTSSKVIPWNMVHKLSMIYISNEAC